MKPDEDPRVVDLRRYRKAARESAAKKARAAPRPGREPLLGSRPRAGLILALVAAAVLALWLLPAIL